MIEENIEMELLRGKDIKIDKSIAIKMHTLDDMIDDIGIKNYNSFISYFANTPYDLRGVLYEQGVLYSDVKHWDLFMGYVMQLESNDIVDAIKYIIGIDLLTYIPKQIDNECVILESIENGNIIDEIKFNYIVDIVREMNGYPDRAKEPVFGNKTSLIYETERHLRRMKKGRNLNGDVSLRTIISSIAWSDSSVSIKDVWGLTLYQLYDGLNRKVKKNRYDNLMFGIYTGNIKQEGINLNKENWFTK